MHHALRPTGKHRPDSTVAVPALDTTTHAQWPAILSLPPPHPPSTATHVARLAAPHPPRRRTHVATAELGTRSKSQAPVHTQYLAWNPRPRGEVALARHATPGATRHRYRALLARVRTRFLLDLAGLLPVSASLLTNGSTLLSRSHSAPLSLSPLSLSGPWLTQSIQRQIRARIHGGRVEKAPAPRARPALLLLLRGHIGGAVAHRRQLRRGGGQPAAAGRHGAAAQVHRHHQDAPLRRRRGGHPRAGRHRRLPRARRGQRRHPRHRRRPQRRRRLARRQRAALRPGHGHLRRRRRQRGARVRGRRPRRRAAPGHAEPPHRRRRGRRRGRGDQVLHRQHHGRARAVRPALHRRVPPGGCRPAAGDPGLPQPHRRALHGQPLPLLRVPVRPAPRHARLLPLPPQRRPPRRRVQDHLHQHVRRAGGRRQVRARPRRLRRRRHRGRRDRVAHQGRPHRARRHRGQRQGVRLQPRRAPQVRRRHAAHAWQAGGHVPVCALRRGPQARAGVRALVRPLPYRPHHGIRRRPHLLLLVRWRRGHDHTAANDADDAEQGGRVVRGERWRDGRAAADGPGLRVLAGGRGLRRHPARGRMLPAQHGARPRRLRHEPALPGRRQPPVELRLPAVRHPHLHQPQLRLVCVHRRPMK